MSSTNDTAAEGTGEGNVGTTRYTGATAGDAFRHFDEGSMVNNATQCANLFGLNDAVLTGLATLVGALVGGAASFVTARYVLKATSRDLEQAERRRLKVECFTNVMGLRAVITDKGVRFAADEHRMRLTVELSRIPALWGDDAEVLRAWRDYCQDGSPGRLFDLIQSLRANAGIPMPHVGRSDIEQLPWVKSKAECGVASGG